MLSIWQLVFKMAIRKLNGAPQYHKKTERDIISRRPNNCPVICYLLLSMTKESKQDDCQFVKQQKELIFEMLSKLSQVLNRKGVLVERTVNSIIRKVRIKLTPTLFLW